MLSGCADEGGGMDWEAMFAGGLKGRTLAPPALHAQPAQLPLVKELRGFKSVLWSWLEQIGRGDIY